MNKRMIAPKGGFSDFNKLAQSALAYRSSKPLLVAMHYDLFTWIETGHVTVERLARKLDLDSRALRILLNALSALGYLRKTGREYRNAPLARRTLVDGRPDYKGNNLKYQEKIWDAWSDLRQVLKTGRPRRSLLDWLRRDAFTRDYIKAMDDISKAPAAELARKLDWRPVRRVLDVGCGPGTYSAEFAARNPGHMAVLFDLPATLEVTRSFVETRAEPERFILRPGNYYRDEFGRGEYDLVLISHVTHDESPRTNLRLVRKAFRALRPNGRLVIHDFLLDEGRDSPAFSAMFALHMLVFTGAGDVYTRSDYSGWMREAGFRSISAFPIAESSVTPSAAIVGVKPGRRTS